MRINLIGPGDMNFHYYELLKLSPEKVNKEIEKIAGTLYSSGVEICLLPDKGISLEIARAFKNRGGKVIGIAPLSDKNPGVEHLKQYINEKVNGKTLFDEIIDSGDWPRQNMNGCLFGDAVLYLGKSPGTEGERNYGVYMYKIINRGKEGMEQKIRNINLQARAGLNFPYTFFIYSPFLSEKFSIEDEAYAKKSGVNLVYLKDNSDLKNKILKFRANKRTF